MTIVKIRGKDTDVSRSDCGRRECFSIGHDQGPYVQGRGYTGTGSGQALCLTRHLHGCPTVSYCPACNLSSVLHITELDGACTRRGCEGKRVDADGNPAPPASKDFKPLVFSIRREYVEMFRRGVDPGQEGVVGRHLPVYPAVDRRHDRRKRFELRKLRPKVKTGERVLIYETAPTQMIVAVAVVGVIYDATPAAIWDVAGAEVGIERWEFDRYFKNRDRAVAIELEPTWLAVPRPLWPTMTPPQSWSRWQGPWPMPSWGMSAGEGG